MQSLTHCAQGDRGCGKSNETTVSGMGLMYSVGIVHAQLIDYFGYSFVFMVGACFPHYPF
jgi:hypothetical protein